MSIAPDQILDTEDPGDDVVLRFHYQHCYAAIHALKTILPHAAVEEVICENHEDILVRYIDGSFVAVQIKTRDLSQPTFKAKDEQVTRALARFAQLETKFPGAFKCYEFLTNHGFWQGEETDNNLPYLLRELKKRGTVKGLRQSSFLRSWISKIATESALSEEQVVTALLKCKHTSRNNTVESGSRDVLDAIAECPGLSSTPFNKLRVTAHALVGLAREASTKSKGASILALYEAGSDLSTTIAHQQLEAKRIRKAQIEAVIASGTASGVETLCVDEGEAINDLPKTLSVMYQKLDRGQLETDRALQLEDLVHSVEALYMRWANRHGVEEANKRMNDLRKIVQFDCTEAKVAASKGGEPYASAMYGQLYQILQERCASDEEKVYNCRPEHLMGAAGALTQECKVWWSEKFELAVTDEPCKT